MRLSGEKKQLKYRSTKDDEEEYPQRYDGAKSH